MILALLVGCMPLVGEWEGQVECDGIEGMDIFIELRAEGDVYVGTGEWDCSGAWWGAECEQTFDVEVEHEKKGELDVETDDCEIHTPDGSTEAQCTDPDDVEWEGGTITGEWSTCDFELERKR